MDKHEINLDDLPEPNVIEELDFEVLLEVRRQKLIEYNPDPNFNTFTTSSDPAAKHYAYAFETSKLQRSGDLWPTDAASISHRCNG